MDLSGIKRKLEEELMELESELKHLMSENEQLKEELNLMKRLPEPSSKLENEMSSMILSAHMENTKEIYRFKEELRSKELEQEEWVMKKIKERDQMKEIIKKTIEYIRSLKE